MSPPQPYYLVLAYNPGRALSLVEKHLYQLILRAFKDFFLH
jgi:hypothetical protein